MDNLKAEMQRNGLTVRDISERSAVPKNRKEQDQR